MLQLYWHPPNPANPARNLAGVGLVRISEKCPDSGFAGAVAEIRYNPHDISVSGTGPTTNDRPTDRPPIWKISNGDTSVTCHPNDPIHLVFGSGVGFTGSPDRMALLLVGQSRIIGIWEKTMREQ